MCKCLTLFKTLYYNFQPSIKVLLDIGWAKNVKNFHNSSEKVKYRILNFAIIKECYQTINQIKPSCSSYVTASEIQLSLLGNFV